MMKTADYAAPALEGKMGLEDPIQILIFIVDISALIKIQLHRVVFEKMSYCHL